MPTYTDRTVGLLTFVALNGGCCFLPEKRRNCEIAMEASLLMFGLP